METKNQIGEMIPQNVSDSLQNMKEGLKVETRPKDDQGIYDTTLVSETPNVEFNNIELGKEEYTLNDLFKIKLEKIPFLVEDLIPKNNLTILAGPSDVGKSTFYTQLVAELVTGGNTFLWKKLNPNNRRALVVSTEDCEVAFSSRIKCQLQGEVPTEKQGNRLRLWTDGNNLIPRLTNYLDQRNTDLIVIDALSDVFKGDMNSGNATRDFLDKLSNLAKRHRTSILVVHHARKTDKDKNPHKDKLLGSVGIEGKARSVLFMSRIQNDPMKRGLHIVKGNYVNDELKSRADVLLFEKDNWTFVKIDDSQNELLVNKVKPGVKKDPEKVELARRLRTEGQTLAEIAKIIGTDKSTISRWLKKPRIKFIVDESFVVP
jgi:archaellum biogenesis ATPase FlaH